MLRKSKVIPIIALVLGCHTKLKTCLPEILVTAPKPNWYSYSANLPIGRAQGIQEKVGGKNERQGVKTARGR